MSELLSGFYSDDAASVCAALRCLCEPETTAKKRIVSSSDVLWREQDRRPWLKAKASRPKSHYRVSKGLWSEALFGTAGDQWGVIELPVPILHPMLAGVMGDLLALTPTEVLAVASYAAWYEDGTARVPPGHPGLDVSLDDISALGSTGLDAWPPFPPYASAEIWREELRRQGKDDTCTDEQLLDDWFAERGLDQAAIDNDDRAWEESWSEKSGVPVLLAALQHVSDECAAKYSLKPEALFVSRVPVPPLRDRTSRPTRGGFLQPGRINNSLVALIDQSARLARLIELDSPPILERNERKMIADKLGEVISAVRGEAPKSSPTVDAPLEAGGPAPASPIWPVPEELDQLRCVTGLAWLPDGKLMIDFPTATVLMDARSGRIEKHWASPGLGLVGSTASGLAWYSHGQSWGFHFYDPTKDSWLTGALPDDVPFAFYESGETSFVVDRETGKISRLAAVCDYPTRIVISACGAYLFASDKEGSGAVYRYDGEVQFPPVQGIDFASPWLHADGEFGADDEREDHADEGLGAVAYCESRDAWHSVQNNGLFVGLEEVFRFTFPAFSAAFSRDGLDLLVACESRIFVIHLAERPEILQCWNLQPLQRLFVGTLLADQRWDDDADPWADDEDEHDEDDSDGQETPNISPAALNTALYRTGTLIRLKKLDASDLAELNTASDYDVPEQVGSEVAVNLISLRDGLRMPAALEPVPREHRRRSP